MPALRAYTSSITVDGFLRPSECSARCRNATSLLTNAWQRGRTVERISAFKEEPRFQPLFLFPLSLSLSLSFSLLVSLSTCMLCDVFFYLLGWVCVCVRLQAWKGLGG